MIFELLFTMLYAFVTTKIIFIIFLLLGYEKIFAMIFLFWLNVIKLVKFDSIKAIFEILKLHYKTNNNAKKKSII